MPLVHVGTEWAINASSSFPPDHRRRLGNPSWRLEEVRDDPGKTRAGGGGLEGCCRGWSDTQPLASQAKRHTPARSVALSPIRTGPPENSLPRRRRAKRMEPRGTGQLGSLLEKQQPLSREAVGRQSCAVRDVPTPRHQHAPRDTGG